MRLNWVIVIPTCTTAIFKLEHSYSYRHIAVFTAFLSLIVTVHTVLMQPYLWPRSTQLTVVNQISQLAIAPLIDVQSTFDRTIPRRKWSLGKYTLPRRCLPPYGNNRGTSNNSQYIYSTSSVACDMPSQTTRLSSACCMVMQYDPALQRQRLQARQECAKCLSQTSS